VQWKTEIPYRGWSTPAILNNQVWLTTATPDGHEFFAICVDAITGKIVSNQKLFASENPEPQGNSVNSYATPSPVVEPGRAFVHFGSYGTAGLDSSAGFKELWRRTDLRCRHYRGPSSSPILYENLLILTFDGADLQYVIALDKLTGKTVWKTDRSIAWNDENVPGQMAKYGDLRKAHSTPIIVKVGDGSVQMLSEGAKAAYGYDPQTGRELWRVHHEAWSAAAAPVYADGLAFIDTGFGGPTELWAVRVDGKGDVTDKNVAWKLQKNAPKMPSPILAEGLLYVISDEGTLSCLDPKSGEQIWREHLPGNYAASPILAEGRIYFCNQQGKTTVIKPGRSFEPIATNSLDTGLMASPAVADNALFLRTKTHLYRLQTGS